MGAPVRSVSSPRPRTGTLTHTQSSAGGGAHHEPQLRDQVSGCSVVDKATPSSFATTPKPPTPMQIQRVQRGSIQHNDTPGATEQVMPCDLEWLGGVLQPPKQPRSLPAEFPGPIWEAGEIEGGVIYEEIEIGKPIGTGSFATVRRGIWRGHRVAIKELELTEVTKYTTVLTLLKEIRYLQTLHHPCLVSCLGCSNIPPHLVLLMEYMPSGSLYKLLFSPKKQIPSLLHRTRMSVQVAEGLAYLHDCFVIHRDLKSQNIVLDKDLNAKICDFGLTITLEKTHMTVESGEGTPRYLAPEQFEEESRITEKVDIWQMGCVLLELFCLVKVFQSAVNAEEISRHLLLKRLPPPLPEDMDPVARVLVQACLRLDAKQRPDAEHLREALAAVDATSRGA